MTKEIYWFSQLIDDQERWLAGLSPRLCCLLGCAFLRQVWDHLRSEQQRHVATVEYLCDAVHRSVGTFTYADGSVTGLSHIDLAVGNVGAVRGPATLYRVSRALRFDQAMPRHVQIRLALDFYGLVVANRVIANLPAVPHRSSDILGTALAAYRERDERGALQPTLLGIVADAVEDSDYGGEQTEPGKRWRRLVLRWLRGETVCHGCLGKQKVYPSRLPLPCSVCGGKGLLPAQMPRYRGFWPLEALLGTTPRLE
jgi:hypothetical protein